MVAELPLYDHDELGQWVMSSDGVAQTEDLRQGRQDDVECGAQSVLYPVDSATSGPGEFALTQRIRFKL